jgi:hypothetical protein
MMVKNWFSALAADFYDTDMQALVTRCDKCLNLHGDYVQNWFKVCSNDVKSASTGSTAHCGPWPPAPAASKPDKIGSGFTYKCSSSPSGIRLVIRGRAVCFWTDMFYTMR